ncbi:hypothetical protein [Burkholderia sp. AW49-1]
MTTENSRADALTDGQLCAVQYATEALRAIAERREQVDDVIRPLNDIRTASRRAAAALKRFEPVANALLAASTVEQPAAAPIEYRYEGGTHWCDLGPAERMRPDFKGVYRLKAGTFPVWAGEPAPSPADERAAFEANARKLGMPLDSNGGHYSNIRTRNRWLGWQARAASANETGAEGVLGYAQRLATGLWEKHWRDSAPQWKVLDDTLGVLTQIDNMVCGLSRSPAMAAEQVAIPAGWKAMPPSATTAMRMAMAKAAADYMQHTGGNSPDAIYEAAFAAAPQPAQADARAGLTDAIVAAAKTVVREELDSVSVHPCDEHDDEVRARQLPDHMQKLYRALLATPPAPEPHHERADSQRRRTYACSACASHGGSRCSP